MKLLGYKIRKRDEQKARALVFLLRLLVLSIPLYIVIVSGVSLRPLQVSTAAQSEAVLEGMGFSVMRQGAYMEAQRLGPGPFQFLISEDSTAWKSLLFLAALIIAVPGVSWNKRLWGIVPGLIVIWLVNIGRVVAIVLAEEAYGTETAILVHDWLWRLGLVLAVLAIWLAWLFWAKRKRKRGLAKFVGKLRKR